MDRYNIALLVDGWNIIKNNDFGVKMNEKNIAKSVGCTGNHFSALKNKRSDASSKLSQKLGILLGCDQGIFCFGGKRDRHKAIKDFLIDKKRQEAKNLLNEANELMMEAAE